MLFHVYPVENQENLICVLRSQENGYSQQVGSGCQELRGGVSGMQVIFYFLIWVMVTKTSSSS